MASKASSPAVRAARRSLLILLILFVALAGVVTLGVFRSDASWTPKLALDLQGGTQILLAPKQVDGQAVSGEQLNQAVSIIRQRVNASGVSEAEVTTQGNQNIAVSIPGKADQATVERLEASAKLDFRTVFAIAPASYTGAETGEAGEAGDTPSVEGADAEGAESADAEGAEQGASTEGEQAEGEAADQDQAATDQDQADAPSEVDPDPIPDDPADPAWLTPALLEQFESFTCDSEAAQRTGEARTDRPLITCDAQGAQKYILGPVELGGESIVDATAGAQVTDSGATTGAWAVNLRLDSAGTKTFGDISTRLYGATQPLDQFAFVIDGHVLLAPQMNGQILDGRPSITGGYTQEGAKLLADQLKFGALPIGFEMQSQEEISATLGANQLQAGLLAGLIGLALVVVYSLFQYRALGLLTVASLVVAGALTYLLLCYFSWRNGYRLSLAGVAGIIVAVGFTADSFILYFERVRDALRDGHMIDGAVQHGWRTAFRTIMASDAINLMAAVILFIFAIANVRGFAFTLGLTTLVDILVVVLFTHPMMTLLARTRFYREGHPVSGLDPRRLGAVYRGRLEFRAPVVTSQGSGRRNKRSQGEAARRQTIAERKAAETAGAPAEPATTARTGKES